MIASLLPAPLPAQAGVHATAALGQWNAPFSWPFVAIHLHVLPNGKVLAWGKGGSGGGAAAAADAKATVWNPAGGGFTDVTYPDVNLFCSGHAFLPDGKLFIAGGHVTEDKGAPNTTLFDYVSNRWTNGPLMNEGRWYPTVTSLPNGEALIIAGSNSGGDDLLPQVWRTSGGLRDLTGALLDLPLYPRMHLAPDGRVFNSGPQEGTRFLDTSGAGSWSPGPKSNWGTRNQGTSVMYDTGKILIVGGGDPPTKTAEVIDLTARMPAWRYTGSMLYARRQLNATVLADGKVLVTGGTSSPGFNNVNGAVLPAEIWDPATEKWTKLSSMRVPRIYHSTAALLPDGRVLSAGSGEPAGSGGDHDHLDAEIYSPPYLFNANGGSAARPSITSAPSGVEYGKTFFIGTNQAPAIRKVTWIRLSSSTHCFNMEQRFSSLAFKTLGAGLSVTAPSNRNVSPPGHYLLFILNGEGVPSVAKIVRIG